MTLREYREALDRLSDEEFGSFRARFGGAFQTRAEYVDNFVHHPGHERRLCQLLDLTTQEERQVSAAIESASAAAESARSARLSMIWSALAVIVAIVALIVSSN